MSPYRAIGLSAVLLIVIAGCAPTLTPAPTPTIELPTAVPPTTVPATAVPTTVAMPKVLLIARESSMDMELMLTKEVNVMISMLEKAGLKVVVASESGQPITGSVTTLKPDMKLSDVKLEDYAGVILPCMAAGSEPTSIQFPPEAVKIVKQAFAQGKPVAAQQSAINILVVAGVLGAKHVSAKGQGVVQDGNITTAGICPYTVRTQGGQDTTTELTQKFITSVASAK